MNEFTLYFVEEIDKTIVYDFNGIRSIASNYKKILNRVCEKELITLKGRIEVIAKIVNRSNNVPLYINDRLLFFKIRAINNIWINYFNILEYQNKNGKTILISKHGETLLINEQMKYFKEIIKTVEKITFYAQK